MDSDRREMETSEQFGFTPEFIINGVIYSREGLLKRAKTLLPLHDEAKLYSLTLSNNDQSTFHVELLKDHPMSLEESVLLSEFLREAWDIFPALVRLLEFEIKNKN